MGRGGWQHGSRGKQDGCPRAGDHAGGGVVGGFPAPVRFSGLSFAYNMAYAIAGGLTPVLLSMAIKDHPAAPIHYMLAMSALGVGLGLYVARRHPRVPD